MGHKNRKYHGFSKTNIYSTYLQMIKRCIQPNHSNYPYYGARGIKVCDRWLESINNFYEDMGFKPFPTAKLDRIDNNGNYEPSNCRWATVTENNRNKRKPSEMGLIKVRKSILCEECCKKVDKDTASISKTQYRYNERNKT